MMFIMTLQTGRTNADEKIKQMEELMYIDVKDFYDIDDVREYEMSKCDRAELEEMLQESSDPLFARIFDFNFIC